MPRTSDTASAFRAARGAIPSPWILNLPWILRAPIIFLYVDMLEADDDFLAQLRKLFVAVALLLAPAPALTTFYNCFTIDGWHAAAAISKLIPLVLVALCFLGYAAARFGFVGMPNVAGAMVFLPLTVMTTTSAMWLDWPFWATMMHIAMAAQLLRVPRMPLALLWCTATFVLSAHNAAAASRGEPEVALWAIPGAIMRDYQSRMLQTMAVLGIAVLMHAGLQVQLMESDKQTRQAQRSSDVALRIAQLLGGYDTEAAAEVLDEARTAKDADPKLIEALEVLVDNLTKYRPHLPNWLLPTSSAHHKSAPRDTADEPESDGDHAQRADDSRSVCSNGSSSDRTNNLAGAAEAAKIHEAAASWFRGGDTFESFVSVASIDFVCLVSETTSFVDTVHRLAGQTAAAVHCFVGDTVVLTWNAASRAVQSEAKAARMVARLMTYAAEAGVRVHGAVVSGKARVQLAGSEGQQKALTVSSELLCGRLSAVAAVGQRLGCIACDYATRSSAGHTVVLQPAGAVTITPLAVDCDIAAAWRRAASTNEAPQRVACYRIGAELGDDQQNDEWMYVLQQHEGSESQAVALLGALDAWAKGDDAAVRRLLRLAPSADADVCAVLAERISEHQMNEVRGDW